MAGSNCSLPGLDMFTPGQYDGVIANYLSFATDVSSPSMPLRAAEFEECTGGKIVFSEASNIWEDPVFDLGTKSTRGSELFDGYFMSYSHFPEVSSLDLLESLNDRIRDSETNFNWFDVLPQVRSMSEYRKNGATSIEFLKYDADFFVPIVRLDLLEKHNMSLPNTWDELVEVVKYFNGTDLNDDGDPNDFGLCHFPRLGAGQWDWWWAEFVYSTWATLDQTEGIQQGFFFDEETMEPRINEGFRYASEIWKELWPHGGNCENTNFVEGRCAVGLGPPGCWKQVFLEGVGRKDDNGTTIWQPTLKSGEYAEPYRFKPFGSTKVVNRESGGLVDCTIERCPRSEVIPKAGHFGDDDRANILPPSPLAGQLINRAPFYWSGGLGTAIRKSSPKEKKDLLWDFFVYTNIEETSVYDVSHYSSWLDAWRESHLEAADTFEDAGWSRAAIAENVATVRWAMSSSNNGAYNLRLPGLDKYTRDVAGDSMRKYIANEISQDELVDIVTQGWTEVTERYGKLDLLYIYRASLQQDQLSEVELCRIHRYLMDLRDPATCQKYDIDPQSSRLLATILPTLVVIIALLCAYLDRRRRRPELVWRIKQADLEFDDPPVVLGKGAFGMVLLATFRGTSVAVKRAVPREQQPTGGIFSAGPGSQCFESMSGSQHLTTKSESARDNGKKAPGLTGFFSRLIQKGAKTDHLQMRSDFIREMKYLSKLRHPCITTLMGAVIDHGAEPMLVMEYMDLGSLHDILHNDTMVLDGSIILSVLKDIAQGVRYLHASDPIVIHGDLKSHNILVDNRFRAKVADFGLSAKQNTRASGTPYWMAPELLRGDTQNTAASDVYSFGIVLYEVYSRSDPYEGEDFEDVIRQLKDPRLNKMPVVPDSCPPKIRALITECLFSRAEIRPNFEELDLQLKRMEASTTEPKGSEESVKTNALLHDVFPKHVAEALKHGKRVEPESKEMVTIFFSDIVNFTEISSKLTPLEVSSLLNRLYEKLDALSHEHHVFKVETIGDAYMAVTNLVESQTEDHARRMAAFAMAAIQAANETPVRESPGSECLKLRVGLHSGPVVASVVGTRNLRYCLFGDTVNTASRFESTSETNRAHCSDVTAEFLREQHCNLPIIPRGSVDMKGKGSMSTFWVGSEFEATSPAR